MTFNASIGAERPLSSPRADSTVIGAEAGTPGSSIRNDQPERHSPEAEGLLQRYLSEIHSYRQLGNAALRELESRLEALSGDSQPRETPAGTRMATSTLMRPSVTKTASPEEKSSTLNDRLRELSTYLHADLTKQQQAQPDTFPAERHLPPRQAPAAPQPANAPGAAMRQGTHKSIPTVPVLDRLWFEERFAEMRSSIDQLAEKIPTARLDALEFQFHALMETLGARESERSMAPVEAGLKKLAAYLEDNRQWTITQDARVQGVEDRLDQLSGLVAQSHAAISATAKGLELVARGTGPELAHKTADLVADKLEERLDSLDPKGAIGELARDVATLATQSTQLARNTDERLRQLQICLDEGIDRLNEDVRDATQSKPKSDFDAETYEDDEDYDDDLSAAQRAARLANGPERSVPQQGEPVRYQIPYGEFLPDEERGNSRTGLVIAAVILLLASAAMLYLNLRDRRAPDARPKAAVSRVAPERPAIAPTTTASIPPAKTAERISQIPRAGVAPSDEVWVTSVIAEETTPRVQATTAGFAGNGANSGNEESLRKAAVQGDLNAQFSIGQDYLDGKGIEPQLPVNERLSKAARWFRRAAENGHAASQYRLATLYELGQGAPKDVAESMIWYERAAEKGHVKAMHNLAVLAITGNGKSANYLTAAKWFARAAEHGLRDSQYNLGILHERGLGVEKNAAKAYQWFAIAAQRGDGNAVQKRDDVARTLTDAERMTADRALSDWVMSPVDEAVNRAAPEPPLDEVRQVEAVIQPTTPSAQLMKTAWSTEIAPRNNLVVEAQRLLSSLGYKPGPADGVIGPRTLAAIREFEKRIGLRPTGQLNEALLARMAFAQI
jgi:hypothetical protein